MIDAANKILYREESYAIVGACMKVHRTLGAGFLEAVYEEALEREFQNQKLTKQYRADFICYDEIIVEIKAVSLIPTAFYAQLQNYLKCTNIELGMLINFGTSSLTYKRMINLK